ncbi:protein translocase SEC61 complex subunit gamma [Candidatus Pacearchaeota archaeon]|nr:protein translocase SEC61 complex subunit gamma [Candidatus Pacearchaeota archaeon]
MNNITQNIKDFFAKSVRVWHILRKPTSKEFRDISKISAFGILILGVIGFIISFIINFFR